jgi:hypothetical protein
LCPLQPFLGLFLPIDPHVDYGYAMSRYPDAYAGWMPTTRGSLRHWLALKSESAEGAAGWLISSLLASALPRILVFHFSATLRFGVILYLDITTRSAIRNLHSHTKPSSKPPGQPCLPQKPSCASHADLQKALKNATA